MKKINTQARYFETNEWAFNNQAYFTIGITDFAQTVFGDINFVELPEIGAVFEKGQPFAVIESNKAANDVTMPMSGKIIAINHELLENPELLNKAPYTTAWLVKMEAAKPSEWEELMTAEQYQAFIGVFFNKT